MNYQILTWKQFEEMKNTFAFVIEDLGIAHLPVYAIWRGGVFIALAIQHIFGDKFDFDMTHILTPANLKVVYDTFIVFDDIIDTRKTFAELLEANPGKKIYFFSWIVKSGWSSGGLKKFEEITPLDDEWYPEEVRKNNEIIAKHIKIKNKYQLNFLETEENSRIQVIKYSDSTWDSWVVFPWESVFFDKGQIILKVNDEKKT